MNLKIVILGLLLVCISCKNKNSSNETNQEVKELSPLESLEERVIDESKSNKDVTMSVRKVLNDKVQIMMPVDFTLMAADVIAQKYPSNNRPEIVYTNSNGTVNLAIQYTQSKATESHLNNVLSLFSRQLQKAYPSIQWLQREVVTAQGEKHILLQFITPALDTSIYNTMYMTDLQGRLLIISSNYTQDDHLYWESISNEIIKSIQIIE